jgi:hypothetical protein
MSISADVRRFDSGRTSEEGAAMGRQVNEYKEELFTAVITLTDVVGRLISSQSGLPALDSEAAEHEGRLCRQRAVDVLEILARFVGNSQTYSGARVHFDDVDARIDDDQFWY